VSRAPGTAKVSANRRSEEDPVPGPRTEIDTSRPNVARVYDYLLGGKDNFAADRDLGARLCDPAQGGYEGLPGMVRENRKFIGRAVRWACMQGIAQFIDLGCGLPTRPAVHETARGEDPLARVAYVDSDPVVLSHVRALPEIGHGIAAAGADLADPAAVLGHPALLEVIDPGRPACVILAAVLHFMSAAASREIVAGYAREIAPGSLLVLSTVMYADPELSERMVALYSAGTLRSHPAADVAGWLEGAGLELVPPGVVTTEGWQGGWRDCRHAPDPRAFVWAAVARKA
jgi:hypothetical protein